MLDSKYFQNFLLIFFSLFYGFLCFYPDFVQKNFYEDSKHIYFSFNESHYVWNNDETMYGPSIRKVLDFFNSGNISDNSILLLKNLSFNIQFIPYIVAGFLSFLIGGIDNFFYFKNLFFPIIGFFLSFLILKQLFKSFFFSLLGTIIFYSPLFSLFNILNLFQFTSSFLENPIGLSTLALKFPSNQFTIIFYFLGLLSILKILDNKNYTLLLIFSLVVSAYSYIFSFISLGFLVFFTFVYAAINNMGSKKNLFIAGFISLVISIPVFYFSIFQDFKDDLLISLAFTKSQNFDILPYVYKTLIMFFLCFIFLKINKKKYENISILIIGQVLPLIIFYYLSYYFFVLPEPQHFFVNYHFSKILIILLVINWSIDFLKQKNFKIISKIFSFCLFSIIFVFIINLSLHQIKISKLKYDMKSKEAKVLIDWIKQNTPYKSVILTLDPFLLNTIPTLTGRYNFISSVKSLNPTSVNKPTISLSNAKIILGLNNEFINYINSSCTNEFSVEIESLAFKKKIISSNSDRTNRGRRGGTTLCEYAYHSYYKIDKGSYHYKKYKELIPQEINVPEKNKTGVHIFYNYANLDIVNKINFKIKNLPNYIILGPTANYFSTKDSYLDYYKSIYSTKNYHILLLKNHNSQ